MFLAKTIRKEQKQETNFATKSEVKIVKPNLTDIVKLREFKMNRKIRTPGQKEKLSFMYEFDLPNSKWTEENFQKVTFVIP